MDETADPDPNEECEIFDTRSEFLDFCKVRAAHARGKQERSDGWMDGSTCPHKPNQPPTAPHDTTQGNHYQFDSLRRAKHSSMMCLYHLLNPEAPKFLPSCVICLKDITSTYKWACVTRGCQDEFAICNVRSGF